MNSNSKNFTTEDELQIYLNMIGDTTIEVVYPFTNTPVLKARPAGERYSIEISCNRECFEKMLHPIGPLYDEMPSYTDVLECMMSSGVLRFSNYKEITESINRVRGLKKKPWFCLDTNMLYRRFFSNFGLIDPRETVLVDTVQNEVESQLNYKYSPAQISALKSVMPYEKHLVDELINRRMKTSRKASYFALRELKLVRDGGAMMADAPEASSSDKERNDQIIAKSLRKLEKERGILAVMLTADSQMIDICNSESLESILCQMPFELPLVTDAEPARVRSLIFSLAAVFGVIRAGSTLVFSEFRGKQELDKVELLFLDNRLGEEYAKSVKICRKLMELQIAH